MRQLLFPEHAVFEDHDKLLNNIARYFGTEEAVARYKVDLNRYSGKAALEEAESVARELHENVEGSQKIHARENDLRPPAVGPSGRRRGKSDVTSKPEPVWPQRRALPYKDELEHLDDILGNGIRQKRK